MRASAAARGPARRVACWSLFILLCYLSAEWVSDHRVGLVSQLSSPARVYHRYFTGISTSALKLSADMDSRAMGNLDGRLTHDKLEELRAFWFEHLTSDTDRAIPRAEHQRRWFFGGKEFDHVCVLVTLSPRHSLTP